MKSARVFEKFIRAIKTHSLLNRGERVVVAVSGGADSVALLYLLLEIRAQFELDLIVAHLNHNFRGKSSDEDEEFVRALAERLSSRLICEKISDTDVANREGNLENWARERRYAFLAKVADAEHAQKVALGHTMSDQAETLLMRLLRGSGADGLSAMSFRRELFIRPLLSIERYEVLDYLRRRAVTWREDPSNLDRRFLRNKLRQELIPSLLDDYNPKIVPLLAGTAAILREESEALRYWAAAVFDREAIVEGSRTIWDVATLVSLPSGLQKRLIRLSLDRLTPGKQSLSAKNVESILHLLREGRGGKYVVSGDFKCFREFNQLVFEAVPLEPEKFRYELRVPGRIELPQTGTSFEAKLKTSSQPTQVLNRWELSLSETELEAGFLIRNWEPGDVYFPPGGNSPKRVAEMLAQRKIPRRLRACWPVVVLGGRIVCVWNFTFCSDSAVQPSEGTRVVVEERSQDR